jgi:DNA-directed RNA polymerase subunit M/transcription elongation factor TFIIS
MRQVVRKEMCTCKNCGNEAEMVITCSLPDAEAVAPKRPVEESRQEPAPQKQVKATATCSHCGNDADMWINL